MPLQKTVVSLPLAMGLDKQNAPELVDNSRFLQLENVVFSKEDLGQLHKRDGYAALPTKVIRGSKTSIGQATQLATFNQEFNTIASGSNLFSYSSGQQGWTQRGYIPPVQVTENQIAATALSAANPDMVSVNNISVYVYESNSGNGLSGGAFIKIIDETNQSVIQSYQLTTPSVGLPVYTPKVVSNGNNIYVLASDFLGNLYAWTVNTASPGSLLGAPTTLISTGLAVNSTTNESLYDACIVVASGPAPYLFVSGYGGINIGLWSFDLPNLFSFESNSWGPVPQPGTIAVQAYGVQPMVFFQNNALDLLALSCPTVALGSISVFTIQPSLPTIVPRITSVPFTLASTQYISIFYEVPADNTSTFLPTIYQSIINASTVVVTPQVFCQSLQIGSIPFIDSNNQLNLLAYLDSDVQATLFLLSQSVSLMPTKATVAGKFYAGNAGIATSNGRIPHVSSNSGIFNVAVTNETEAISVNNTIEAVYGISELVLNTTAGTPQTTQLGQNLHIATEGQVLDYDGLNITEHNFNYFPEAVTTSFNTSQLAIITDVYDRDCNTAGENQSSYRIAIPDNGATPGGPVGQLITPGEYITFNAVGFNSSSVGNTITPHVVFFVVGGTGSAPTGASFIGINHTPCNITAGMNAIEVASALYTTLSGLTDITSQYAVSYTPNPQGTSWTNQYIDLRGFSWTDLPAASSPINVTPVTPVALSPPTLNRVCTATQIFSGANSFAYPASSISFIPANLISSGQYVVLEVPCASSVYTQEYALIYFWFSNPTPEGGNTNQNISAGDPDPFGIGTGVTETIGGFPIHRSSFAGTGGNFIGINIILAGTENEQTVATLVGTALVELSSTYVNIGISGIIQVGSTVGVICNLTNPTGINTWTNNPSFVGLGQGYVGQNTTNTPGYAVVNYSALYEWVDNSNQLHQSTPAPATSVYIPVYAVTGGLPVETTPVCSLSLGSGAYEIILTAAADLGTTLTDQGYTADIVLGGGSIAVTRSSATNFQIALEVIPSPSLLSDVVTAVNACFTDGSIVATLGANAIGSNFAVTQAAVPFSGGSVIAPSTAIAQSVQCSTSLNIEVLPLNLTTKTNVDIALFRTITNQPSVAYRFTPPTKLLLNTPGTAKIGYNDFSADIDNAGLSNGIDSNQILYTTGGVINNSAPPGFTFIINHQNRLFGVSAENPQLIYYSQGFTSGYEIAFNLDQTITMNPSVANIVGGEVTGLASMDGYLIVFQENQIWYITGTGPSAVGPTSSNYFNPPVLVASSSSIGCRDPGSIVLTPKGLMFKSNQGFYLLDRSLSLEFIGAPVKSYNADIVSSAQSLISGTELIFLSVSGTPLIYDTFYDCWGTFTNHQGSISIRDINGVYNYINTDGIICVQQPGSYIDANNEGYSMLVQTAWLKMGNVQGYQRIWRAFFEGFFLGTQPYSVTIAYNYSTNNSQTLTLNPGAGTAAPSVWGNSPVWGDYVWGEDGGTVSYPDQIQFRVAPNQQLCQSMQFTFQDLAPFSTIKTPALNALDMEIGVRQGGFKVGVGSQIG